MQWIAFCVHSDCDCACNSRVPLCPAGEQTLAAFEARICRWYRLRVTMLPQTAVLEFISECFPLGVLASWALSYVFGVSATATFFCHCLAWFLLDYALISVLSSCRDVLPLPSPSSSSYSTSSYSTSSPSTSKSTSSSTSTCPATSQSESYALALALESRCNAVPTLQSTSASSPHSISSTNFGATFSSNPRVSHTRAASCKWPASSEQQSGAAAPASPPPSAQPALETLCEIEAPTRAAHALSLSRGVSLADAHAHDGATLRHSCAASKSSNPSSPPAESAHAAISFESAAAREATEPTLGATALSLARGLLESAAPSLQLQLQLQQSKAARSLSPSPTRSQTSFVSSDSSSMAAACALSSADETRVQLLPERERDMERESESAAREARTSSATPFPFSNLEIFMAWLFRESISVPLQVRGMRTRTITWRNRVFELHLWGQTTESLVGAKSRDRDGPGSELPSEELVGSGCPGSSLLSLVCCPHRTLAHFVSRRCCLARTSRCLILSRLRARKPLLTL